MFECIFWFSAGALIYTHGVYPLLMLLAAACLGRCESAGSSGGLPSVSLIIPALNEESVIKRKLENALCLHYPQDLLEIIVIDDGSTDKTSEVAAQFKDAGVRLLAFDKRKGKASALNAAAQEAIGDLLLFCDANVLFDRAALQQMVARLGDPRIGAVSGDVRLQSERANFGVGESLFYWFERHIQLGESMIGSVIGVDGGMYVIRRECFRTIRSDTILDDFWVSMQVIRQGCRIVYEPTAIASECATIHARTEFRRRIRISAGAWQSVIRGCRPPITRPIELGQYLSHKLLRWLAPIWLLGICGSSLALFHSHFVYQVGAVVLLGIGVIAAAAALVVPLRRNIVAGVCFYYGMSHVAMTIGLVKGMFNRQPVTWQRTDRSEEGEIHRSGFADHPIRAEQ